jgi:hypothetical protein
VLLPLLFSTGETNMGSISIVRKPPHAKTFGMELECYTASPTMSPYEIIRKQWHGFWEATEDGSIYGGVEFVSQPMPYNMLVKQINWLHHKFPWTVTNKCGLHIHVSRQYWSDKREREFSGFLQIRGTAARMSQWFGRISHFADAFASRGDKFRAINVCHDHTYEFRVWKAGDLAWTLEALRRTRAIVECQGQYTVEWMDKLCGGKPQPTPETLGQVLLSRIADTPAAVPAVLRIRRIP